MNSFKLKFEGTWLNYLVLGIILGIFGREIANYGSFFVFVGVVLGIAGIFYFLKGVYLLFRRVVYGKNIK